MGTNATDKPVPREITALLSDERLILRETQRAVTPFGGIAVFILFLGKIGFAEAIRQHMPIRWRSPNHIDPSCTFTAFLVSVLVGARRFAHASLLRGDRALHALLGMDRFPPTIPSAICFASSAWARCSACLNRWPSGRCNACHSAQRATPWIWIRQSLNVMASRRVRSMDTTRANTVVPAIILCWPC